MIVLNVPNDALLRAEATEYSTNPTDVLQDLSQANIQAPNGRSAEEM